MMQPCGGVFYTRKTPIGHVKGSVEATEIVLIESNPDGGCRIDLRGMRWIDCVEPAIVMTLRWHDRLYTELVCDDDSIADSLVEATYVSIEEHFREDTDGTV